MHGEYTPLQGKNRPENFLFKLLTIFGSFLKKTVMREIFSPNYNILLEVFEELNNCRCIRDEHIKKVLHNAEIKDYFLVGS